MGPVLGFNHHKMIVNFFYNSLIDVIHGNVRNTNFIWRLIFGVFVDIDYSELSMVDEGDWFNPLLNLINCY